MSKLIKPIPSLEEQQKEKEKLNDILLLLDHLFKREQATAKIILGNLYDIGTINLINHKVPPKFLSPVLKLMATTSKPLVSIIAVRVFQTYCPKLVTNYLYSLVEFTPPPVETESSSLREVQGQLQEVKVLRKKVKLLIGSLWVMIAICACISLFIAYKFGFNPS